MRSALADARKRYHRSLCAQLIGIRKATGACSIADKDNKSSVAIAGALAAAIGCKLCAKPPDSANTIGSVYCSLTRRFVEEAFLQLHSLRTGTWVFYDGQSDPGVAIFDQYEHPATLERLAESDRDLAAAIGYDYLVKPDIIIAREPVEDSEINADIPLVSAEEEAARLTPLRKRNAGRPILHASISCKCTIRSDRGQNTRTEALNLIRNRKGHAPHIVAVTAEPLPTRLASLALGTGDIDCVYHSALPELRVAVSNVGNADQLEMLETLVDGRRLRDISDLPFDLAS